MQHGSQPFGSESALPFVPQEVVNELLQSDAMHPGFVADEWHELSIANPHLRDLVTLIAVSEEPHDIAARQKVINHCMLLLGAIERGLLTERLEELMAKSELDEAGRADLIASLAPLLEMRSEQAADNTDSPGRTGRHSKLQTAFAGLRRFGRLQPKIGDAGA
jgi:hypothetical protein